MPALHAVLPRSSDTDSQSTQSLLQHTYFIAAVAIVVTLVILRIVVLRWRHQALSDFFRINSSSQYAPDSQSQNDPHYRSIYHGLQLAPPPTAYHPERRVRAADTDAYGRRLDLVGENWEGKDALPAYDNVDRPPKYVEAGWTHGQPPPANEQSAVAPSLGAEQGGRVHPNTADGTSMEHEDQPLDHSHATTSGTHETEELPPVTHDDSTGS